MATYRADITKSIEPAMANPALLGRAAEAKAGAMKSIVGLAEDMYKGYVSAEMASIEEQAAQTAGEFFISGQAAEEAARRIPAVAAARGTVFETQGPLLPAQQEAVEKQLSAFDSELTRLKSAVEGGMSNEQYVSRIDSLTKQAIAKFPGMADKIRERVSSVTGMPGADRWAQMTYVRERFTPPKEGGSKIKTAEDMALKDIDEAGKKGTFGTREELLSLYRTNRPEYDKRMTLFKQVLDTETQTKNLEAYWTGQRNQSDAQADQARPSFAAVFSGSLGTSVLTAAVQGKEEVYGKVLDLMSKGENVATNIVPFENSIKLHQAQMRTNIENARRVAYTTIDTYVANNPNISDAKRKELYADADRLAESAKSKYADDKGVGLVAMANIMRTYRDKSLAEKAQLFDLAVKQQSAMQNNPMVMAYWAGGADRENLKRTNRSFYEFMVGQEQELTGSIAGVRNEIKGATDLASVQRVLVLSQQDGKAVPVDPVVTPQVTRAAHQAQMASAVEVLKKASLSVEDVNAVSSAFSTSAVYGANSQIISKDYRRIGDKILKLSEPDQAIIKSNVSSGITQSVKNVLETKQFIEQRYGNVKLQLGVNDAGEIAVVRPTPTLRQGPAGRMPAPEPLSQSYLQAADEFTRQLKPVLNNMVSLRAMLTQEQPKAVGQDFATLINNNQPYGGFFSMEAKPVAAPVQAAPAASAAGGKRTANMADVARYAAEKKISVSDAVSQLEAEGVDVVGN